MTESFPRQEARTRRFTLGAPRAFRVSPDGARVAYLRTKGGADPVTCLWVLDVDRGRNAWWPTRGRSANPKARRGRLPAQERARRERVREQAGGIVAYATDQAVTMAAFALSGHVYAVPLTGGRADVGADIGADTGPTSGRRRRWRADPALDPRPDPSGRRLAYVCDGALRVTDLAGAGDRVIADLRGAPG